MYEIEVLKVKRPPRFVNVGEDPRTKPKNAGWIGHRQWRGCLKYNFISAGQGLCYSSPLENLEIGDYIAAYITGEGYVGIGIVTKKSIIIRDFRFGTLTLQDFNIDQRIIDGTLENNEYVTELDSIKKTLFRNAFSVEKSDYAVEVNWIKYVTRENAKWKKNADLFASRLTQCSLEKQPITIKFLEDSFNIRFQIE